jgi:putative ABC transport system permease protein
MSAPTATRRTGAMTKVSLRNLAAHKVRLLLTVVAVLLGTAFVAGSFVFTDTLQRSFGQIVSTTDKNIDARVQPRHDYDPGVPVSLVPRIAAVPGVQAVQPDISAPIVLVDSHGTKVSPGGAPSVGGPWLSAKESVAVVPTFVSGHAPDAPNEVVVNSGAATRGHLRTGDRVKVVLPNANVVTAHISGIYRVSFQTGGYIGVLFPPQQAMRLFTDGSHVAAVDIAADPGVSEQTVTDRIAAVLPADLQAKTGGQVRTDDSNGVASALSFVNYLLLSFGIIALLVGTFIIYNTFSMLVAQRLRELALLRAIGASRKQIRRSVVFEAGVIGLIGSALGLAGGVGLAFGLHSLLDTLNFGLPSGGMVLSARTVLVSILLGTGVTLFAAYAPARRAARIAPVAAMREEFAAPSASSLRRRTIAGSVVGGAGVVATVGGATASDTGSAASLIGLGLLGVCAGAMLLSPVLARWVIGPLGRVVGRPFGAVGQLARTNAVRNPRRTAATAFALTLGLVLVAGISVIGASAKASVSSIVDNDVRADYILTTQAQVSVPIPAAAAAAQVAGVASITEIHNLVVLVDGSQRFGSAVDGPLTAVLKVHMKHGTPATSGTDMIVSSTTAAKYHWTMGSTHTMSLPGMGSVHETVAGIYADDQLLGPFITSGQVYRQLTPRNQWSDEVALVKAAPGTNLAALRAGLNRATNNYYVVDVQDRTQFKGQVAGQINGLLGLLYGLLGLAIVIAILGIVNTLALSVVERKREIGMLRAIGMQRAQVRRTLYLESLLIALFGAVLGLALGIGFGALFTHTLHAKGLPTLSVPWEQALLFLVLAGFVGVLAALWPGTRAARTKPLAAIVEA